MATLSIKPTRGVDWWKFVPGFWMQNDATNRVWDAALNEALDVFGVSNVDRHTCQVGPFQVWIENWPYAYGNKHPGDTGLPMVRTRRRLRRMVAEGDRSEASKLGQQLFDACQQVVSRAAKQEQSA